MGLKQIFRSEVRREIRKFGNTSPGRFEEKDIEHLPEPVKRYFRHCGYLGRDKMINAKIIWNNAFLRTAPEKEWMKIETQQFNSVPEPCRIVYMKNNIKGIIPFEGRDKLQDGHGNMNIRLAKIITIADDKSREMDQSAMVTTLAESLIVPYSALQNYMKWDQVDDNTAEAVMEYNDITVKGRFYFNEKGENTLFETDDRYRSERGQNKLIKWFAYPTEYSEKNGIKFPTELRAAWKSDKNDFEYYRGTIEDLEYNISDI